MEFGRAVFENTFVVAIENINFQTIIIASYLIGPVDYWTKVTTISATLVSVKYLEEIAVGLARFRNSVHYGNIQPYRE